MSRQGFYFEWKRGFRFWWYNPQRFLGDFSRANNLKFIYAGVLELADELASGRVTIGDLFGAKRIFRFWYKLARVLGCFSRVKNLKSIYAGVLELADELASGASVRKDVWVQIPPPAPWNTDKKDIMPTNGGTKPFVGINLAKNRIHDPQIFSTRKWTWTLP